VDCPECRSRDKDEKAAGLAAKDYVKGLLHDGGTYTLTTKEKGKFGRYLGVIKLEDGTSINGELVKENLAVAYHGQNKSEIQNAHKENYKKLKEKGII
jgi:endonuclease YncB( thermonuclease family)